MPLRLSAKVVGLPQAQAALKHLPVAIRNRALRAGFRRIGQMVAKDVKSQIPGKSDTRTGQTKKSIGFKVKLYRMSGNISVVIGPRSGFSVELKTKRGARFHNPTRVFQFQNNGKQGQLGRKYLETALQRNKPKFPSVMQDECQKAIAKYDASKSTSAGAS